MSGTFELEQLRQLVDGRHVVRLERGELARYHGLPVALSDTLLMMHSLDEFFVDGRIVLRLEDITEVQHGDDETFVESVLAGEGLLENLPGDAVRLSSWAAALEDIGARYGMAIVEAEHDDEFLIGTIVGVGESEAEMLQVSVDGLRDVEPSRIALDRITRVTFGDRYSTLYAKYARR